MESIFLLSYVLKCEVNEEDKVQVQDIPKVLTFLF
jgi:hypothetical protein